MWIQCALNRIAWAIPEVMNNELMHNGCWADGRWSLCSRCLCVRPLAVFLVHKRCCGSSVAGTATSTREPARDRNGVLVMFPESSVNAPDAHSIHIDSERFQIGVNAHHNRLLV